MVCVDSKLMDDVSLNFLPFFSPYRSDFFFFVKHFNCMEETRLRIYFCVTQSDPLNLNLLHVCIVCVSKWEIL